MFKTRVNFQYVFERGEALPSQIVIWRGETWPPRGLFKFRYYIFNKMSRASLGRLNRLMSRCEVSIDPGTHVMRLSRPAGERPGSIRRAGMQFVKWDEAADYDVCELNAHMRKLSHDLNWLLFKPYALEELFAALYSALDEVQSELRKRSGLE